MDGTIHHNIPENSYIEMIVAVPIMAIEPLACFISYHFHLFLITIYTGVYKNRQSKLFCSTIIQVYHNSKNTQLLA